jgi:hypothetical protein
VILKKTILIYHLIVILVCLTFNSIAIFDGNGNLAFLLLSEALLGIGLYYIIKTTLDLNHYRGNLFLLIFNLIQTLAIGLYGFTYKLVYGPQIYFKIHNFDDWTTGLDFHIYSREFYINVTSPDGLFYLGFNILNILFAIYFFNFIKKEYGHISFWMRNTSNIKASR